MKKLLIACAWAIAVCACQPDSDSADSDYLALVGAWSEGNKGDTVLNINQVCCGNKAVVRGDFKLGGQTLALGGLSSLIHYSIQKPDSSAKYANTFELYLQLQTDLTKEGSLCGLDGFIVDSSGNKEFPDTQMTAPFGLELTKLVVKDAACGSTSEQVRLVATH